ncbi:PH domain-containing protein [Weissella viridescens]|uniref:PH domain-containing protein n=1 Tax=Weissella viridescens TaxID=1629 RepID=UPI0022E962BF|nr:PH domain-containing protein [Weissella viridescens]
MNKQAKAFFLIKGEQVLLDVLFLIPMCQVFIHALHRPDFAVPIWCIFVLYQVIAIGLTYQHTTYQIKTSSIRICYGCFEHRSFELNQKQALVNYRIEQNWLQQLLNVSGLTLYFKNGGDETQVTFCALKKTEVEQLELVLNHLQTQVVTDAATGVQMASGVTPKRLIVTGLLSANYLLMVPVLMDLAQMRDWVALHVGINIPLNGWMIALVLMLMPGWSIGMQYFKYAKFKLIVHADHFAISNGWIERDRNVLRRDDVMGIKIEQSFGLRLLRLYQVSAILNDPAADTQTKCLLIPLASQHQVRTWINDQFGIAFDQPNIFSNPPKRDQLIWAVGVGSCLLAGIAGLYQLIHFSWIWLLVLGIAPLLRPFLTQIEKPNLELLRVQVGYINRSCYCLPPQIMGSETQFKLANYAQLNICRTDQNPALRFIAVEALG